MNPDELDRTLARYLRTLPTALPPPALGARILARHRARRRRPLLLAAAAAAAAALVLAVAPRPLPPAAAGLEPAQLADVRALDRALQAGYARRADPEQLAALWAAREQAVDRLADPTVARPQPIRL